MRQKIYSIFSFLLIFFWANNTFAQNLSLRLDGKDNNVRTGIGFMKAPWTIEAWIKGDDFSWKQTEVIFGGGEYSTYTQADNFPLVVREGKIYSTKAGIGSSQWLDNQWHHVALSCDSLSISLYIDGKLEAHKDTSVIIIPGAIGVSEEAASVFGGCMDEIRIWETALSSKEINEWMNKPLDCTHPHFSTLKAYYNFDEGIDDTALNWVGAGYHSYHLRNGRVDYSGYLPIATTVSSDNKKFIPYNGKQRLFNAVSIESEWDSEKGSKDEQMVKLRLVAQGKSQALRMEQLTLDLTGTDKLTDLTAIHIYYDGKTARDSVRKLLTTISPKRKITVDIPSDKQFDLSEGANYLLVTADLSSKAHTGHQLRISIPSCKLSGQTYSVTVKKNAVPKEVGESSFTNPQVFRILQWNIWHGGRHIPLKGHDRIIELIKASKADIITMQEGYGFQKEIAKALNFHLQTPSEKDNLALYSRYPIKAQPSSDSFRSNPGIVTMPNGRSILINNCWVSYSYQPDYTGSFPDCQHNPKVWIAEDSIRPMANTRDIVIKDVQKIQKRLNIPTILGGDFNSCSHLDWTQRAASLHAGFGPVDFPTSRYLMAEEYKDSFREVHPNEVERPEGTFAGIYGQLDFSRIDFIYYRGKQIQTIQSKIIQTPPEIDDIWASDHSAVLTTFIWK